MKHSGNSEFVVQIAGDNSPDSFIRSKSLKVNPCDELIEGLGGLIGVENVWFSRHVPSPEVGEGDKWWLDR